MTGSTMTRRMAAAFGWLSNKDQDEYTLTFALGTDCGGMSTQGFTALQFETHYRKKGEIHKGKKRSFISQIELVYEHNV